MSLPIYLACLSLHTPQNPHNTTLPDIVSTLGYIKLVSSSKWLINIANQRATPPDQVIFPKYHKPPNSNDLFMHTPFYVHKSILSRRQYINSNPICSSLSSIISSVAFYQRLSDSAIGTQLPPHLLCCVQSLTDLSKWFSLHKFMLAQHNPIIIIHVLQPLL